MSVCAGKESIKKSPQEASSSWKEDEIRGPLGKLYTAAFAFPAENAKKDGNTSPPPPQDMGQITSSIQRGEFENLLEVSSL